MSAIISPGIQTEEFPFHLWEAKAEDYIEYIIDMSTEDVTIMEFMENLSGIAGYHRNLLHPEWIVGCSIIGASKKFTVYVRKGTSLLLKMDIAVGRNG